MPQKHVKTPRKGKSEILMTYLHLALEPGQIYLAIMNGLSGRFWQNTGFPNARLVKNNGGLGWFGWR
jgi:hypothetical protein